MFDRLIYTLTALWVFPISTHAAPMPAHPSEYPSIPNSDFESLKALSHNNYDASGRPGDPGDKYFHESTFNPHYDGRFSWAALKNREQHEHLSVLMRHYLETMHTIEAETWIMHGSLLGWWWNKKIMPWDSDVDVQMSEAGMKRLAEFNMTVHNFEHTGLEAGKNYLIEVNPHWTNASQNDKLNVIDARWIDTDTGLFIDITTVRPDPNSKPEEGRLVCKDKHHYLQDQIFPLRESDFEGIRVKVPYAYSQLLIEEYGHKALTESKFNAHTFNQEQMEWLPNNPHVSGY